MAARVPAALDGVRPDRTAPENTMTNKTAYAPPAAGQLQYVHLEKLYGYLPGLTAALRRDAFGQVGQVVAVGRGHDDAQRGADAADPGDHGVTR
jgi:hypothetical protein